MSSTSTSIDPLFVWTGLVPVCCVALVVLVAWVRGASVKALIGMAVAGIFLAFVTWSVIGLSYFGVVIVAAASLPIWMPVFLLVHRFGHRAAR